MESLGERRVRWFADEQVDVLGHDDVAEDFEVVALAGEFEGVEEDVFCVWGVEIRFTAVTTEGDEVIVTFLLVSYEAQRHGWILLCLDSSSGVENRVPHLRRGLIATKVGSSCGA